MKESFNFLRRQAEDTYIECYGVDFEDFDVGQVFEHRPGRTFEEGDCHKHALQSLDLTPHLVDRNYARAVRGEKMQVAETYLLSMMAMTTKTFGKVVANLSLTDVVLKPVYAGDTILLESEILGKRESASRPDQGILHVRTRAHNQHGDEVCRFERKFLVYRKGHGPYRAAGY
ncbi:MAG: MaoC family dehydratase [Sphingopyxis granuli]|uniref:MaoC family dehydratase n=1 Tax=Sphingopyxis granuli TaxID=267128 RepID=UPI003C738633